MKARWLMSSSQAKAKPGTLMGCRLYRDRPMALRYLHRQKQWGGGEGE